MRIVYWLLALVSMGLLIAGLAFFTSPDSANVAKEDLDQWYVMVTIISSVLGGLTALGVGLLVPKKVKSRAGEAASAVHTRVILWGFGAGVLGTVLSILVTVQLAYGRADWQLSPSERVSLVVGSGRFVLVAGAAWLTSAIVYTALVSTPLWTGRKAIIRSL